NLFVFLPLESDCATQFNKKMKDELFESIPQGGSIEETAENRRILEVADELRRGCQLYEAELRSRKENVNSFEIEQRVAERYAKEFELWIPIQDIANLGVPGPCGNENELYVSNDIIYKVNNLLNSGSILRLLNKLVWHNNLFYETAYTFHGFTGFDGRTVMPVLQQKLIKNAVPASLVEIGTYMAALGFEKKDTQGRYENRDYEVWDLLPRNVLKDSEGDIYIIDAEIYCKNGVETSPRF
ncbi:MAG: hypothetical protein IJR53_04680, partial [Bacteroidales bacterium]|nr:hypothetical protein [Bacteroidales bacterium]